MVQNAARKDHAVAVQEGHARPAHVTHDCAADKRLLGLGAAVRHLVGLQKVRVLHLHVAGHQCRVLLLLHCAGRHCTRKNTSLPPKKVTRDQPAEPPRVPQTNGCRGWELHCDISLDFKECWSSKFEWPASKVGAGHTCHH